MARNNHKKPKKQLTILEGPRVRFAPAPTGALHIGGARTILFNWLFARKYSGSFILRIEDTDPERSKRAFETEILESIRWLGMDWDEGPDIGGAYGPYRQSERTAIYERYIKDLLASGLAYHCFCSEEDLEAERQQMLAEGIAPKYSGRCRVLSEHTVAGYLKAGKPYLVRFKMPSRKVAFQDIIHGKIEFDTALFGDIVIARGATMPLYNLAAVIDDCEMKISHVIRGDEHISNTPKQIMLQEALGFPQPAYAHVPLLLAPDRAKLSKRHGATSIQEYRDLGYLPEALFNFLALLGWHPLGEKEIFTREELIQEFSLERVQKAGAVFTQSRLDWLNAHYIRQQTADALMDPSIAFLVKVGLVRRGDGEMRNPETDRPISKEYVAKIIELEKERLQKLADLPELAGFFFKAPRYDAALLAWKEMSLGDVVESLARVEAALGTLQDTEFKKERMSEVLAPHYGRDKGEILWPLRVALTGRKASPGPLEIAEILGKTEVIARLRYAKTLLSKI